MNLLSKLKTGVQNKIKNDLNYIVNIGNANAVAKVAVELNIIHA